MSCFIVLSLKIERFIHSSVVFQTFEHRLYLHFLKISCIDGTRATYSPAISYIFDIVGWRGNQLHVKSLLYSECDFSGLRWTTKKFQNFFMKKQHASLKKKIYRKKQRRCISWLEGIVWCCLAIAKMMTSTLSVTHLSFASLLSHFEFVKLIGY